MCVCFHLSLYCEKETSENPTTDKLGTKVMLYHVDGENYASELLIYNKEKQDSKERNKINEGTRKISQENIRS